MVNCLIQVDLRTKSISLFEKVIIELSPIAIKVDDQMIMELIAFGNSITSVLKEVEGELDLIKEK
jgi:hypothetical protein